MSAGLVLSSVCVKEDGVLTVCACTPPAPSLPPSLPHSLLPPSSLTASPSLQPLHPSLQHCSPGQRTTAVEVVSVLARLVSLLAESGASGGTHTLLYSTAASKTVWRRTEPVDGSAERSSLLYCTGWAREVVCAGGRRVRTGRG